MADPYEGMWDFDGAWAPPENGSRYQSGTFSLGCFQWVRRANGKGLKRGKVQKRFSGPAANPGPVYAKARLYCAERNEEAGNG